MTSSSFDKIESMKRNKSIRDWTDNEVLAKGRSVKRKQAKLAKKQAQSNKSNTALVAA